MEQVSPLTISEADGRIILKISGALSKERLASLKESVANAEKLIEDTFNESGNMVDVLLDLQEFSGDYDMSALEVMTSLARSDAGFVRKTAGYGAPEKGTIAGEITVALADRENIKFFPSKDEALEWLSK